MNTTATTNEETMTNSDAAEAARRAARPLAYEVATLDGPNAWGVTSDDVAESIAAEIAAQFGLAEELAYDIAFDAAEDTLDMIWSS